MRRFDALEETIKNAFGRLTEEVVTLRREFVRKRKDGNAAVPKVLPSAPIKNLEELLQLEDTIKDADAFNGLVSKIFFKSRARCINFCTLKQVHDLVHLIAGTAAEFVRVCWRSIMDDEVAQHFTWFRSM